MPNALPHAQAQSTNANLFVSAENSQWNNYFAGPQVVQVVVADPDINRLDQSYGEPVVTVNGKRLRMAQATDGNWYAYFADRNQAITAANTQVGISGKGLNFGGFCSSTSALGGQLGGLSYSDTKGFTIAQGGQGSTNHTLGHIVTSGTFGSCTDLGGNDNGYLQMEHVVRQNKTLNYNPSGFGSSKNMTEYTHIWPVIQLYDFSAIPTTVTVDYQKNGGDQIVNLTFDRIPQNLITTTADRSAYPQNSQVFIQINDPQLNIDPTEDDSWTWGTNANNNTAFYELFNRNGGTDADGTAGAQNLVGNMTTMMFNHNGKLTFAPTAQSVRVVDFEANGKQIFYGTQRGDPAKVSTKSVTATTGSQPMTFNEQGGVNTGIFGNWDGGKKSNVVTVDSPIIRGQSAVVRYNDISTSIVGGFAFATLTQTAQNNTWASGQRIPVTLTDNDDNKNAKLSERMFLWDPTYKRSTAMVIGTPFTLSSGGVAAENATLISQIRATQTAVSGITTVRLTGGIGVNNHNASSVNKQEDEAFSARPIFNFTNQTGSGTFNAGALGTGTGLFIDLKTTMNTLLNTIHPTNRTLNTQNFKGFNFLNYDVRSFSSLNQATGGSISNVQVFLAYNATGTALTGHGGKDGLPSGALNLISLVNDTNTQDFVNLNGTTTNGVTGSPTAQVANPAQLNKDLFNVPKTAPIGILINFTTSGGNVVLSSSQGGQPIVVDFFSVGLIGDGTQNNQRINNGIYRYELEETGDNTGVFTGTNQYLMLNQLNIFDPNTYSVLRTIQHDVYFPAIQDMLQSEARAPQITYLDLGADGVNTQISAQQDIPTHTGVISFDSKTYKIGDTVTITLADSDLNVNNDLIDIYTAVKPTTGLGPNSGNNLGNIQDNATDTIGKAGLGTLSDGHAFGRLADVEFGQQNVRWSDANMGHTLSGATTAFTSENTGSCFGGNNAILADDNNTATVGGFASSLSATGFSLVETGPSTGIFTGTFEVPDQLCQNSAVISSVGQNIKVNYVDFRDDSGKTVEVSDNAGIQGNTGSVKLDKAVYPVPFGSIATAGVGDFPVPNTKSTTSEAGVFPMHRDLTGSGLTALNTLSNGDVLIHIRVNDQDFNLAATGTDHIAQGVNDVNHGPVAVQITRQGNSVLLATAGGPAVYNGGGGVSPGTIVNLNGTAIPATATGLNGGTSDPTWPAVRDLGPMTEIAPDAGIFQADLPIRYSDGPTGTDCPSTQTQWTPTDGTTSTAEKDRFHTVHSSVSTTQPSGNYCVRQGDVLTVTYTDLNDASGHTQTVTDSSTFDLRNGVLQSDKSVYIIGSDMILTLVEPDLNLDSQTAETVPLDVIEWDSHAFKGTMGQQGGQASAFDAKPGTFVETGKDTGIFQSVIKIPSTLNNNLLERGEQIQLEYTDWGPAGSKVVGANSQDIDLTIYTSNFGATVELDQKVYTWTDRVYITVVAPDHNFDPNLIDTIGTNNENTVSVSTRGNSIPQYQLVETGVDTGIFTGYVILTGDPNLKGSTGVDGAGLEPTGSGPSGVGPTDGFLPSEEQDGVSVSFEFTRDQTVTGSALIRWNIGEIKWLEASYPANG